MASWLNASCSDKESRKQQKENGLEQLCPSGDKMTFFNCSGGFQNEVSISSGVKINLDGTVCMTSCYVSGSAILGEVVDRIKSVFQANKGSEMYLLMVKMIQINTSMSELSKLCYGDMQHAKTIIAPLLFFLQGQLIINWLTFPVQIAVRFWFSFHIIQGDRSGFNSVDRE